MINRFFQILGIGFVISSLLLFWGDMRNSEAPSKLAGQLWYELSPGSLQLTEAVIDRYIDPCALLTFLGCDTFIWHPIIATILTWPAGLVLGLIGVILLLATSFRAKRGRKSVRSLRMDGHK